jgi:uncharacterized protein
MPSEAAWAEHIGLELKQIREHVPGVRGSVAATSDGILLAHDVYDLEPTQIAALVAAMHAVAVRAAFSTESGQLRDVVTRASDGYLAVYAAGRAAIVAVLGTTELNLAILNYQAPAIIDRVAGHLAGIARRPQPEPEAEPEPDAGPGAGEQPDADESGGLPSRRSPADERPDR